MKRFATILLTLSFLATSALATDPDILINGGTVDFDYAQVPSGPITGHFGSDGSLVAAPVNEGSAATTYLLDGMHYLTVVGAIEDGTNFVDGAVIILKDVAPITDGTYELNGTTGVLVFVDDAVGWTPPADLWNTNWTLELAAIVAAGKYASISGCVTVTTLGPSRIQGTFSGVLTNQSMTTTLNVVCGTFNVEEPTAVDSASWTSVKGLYR